MVVNTCMGTVRTDPHSVLKLVQMALTDCGRTFRWQPVMYISSNYHHTFDYYRYRCIVQYTQQTVYFTKLCGFMADSGLLYLTHLQCAAFLYPEHDFWHHKINRNGSRTQYNVSQRRWIDENMSLRVTIRNIWFYSWDFLANMCFLLNECFLYLISIWLWIINRTR